MASCVSGFSQHNQRTTRSRGQWQDQVCWLTNIVRPGQQTLTHRHTRVRRAVRIFWRHLWMWTAVATGTTSPWTTRCSPPVGRYVQNPLGQVAAVTSAELRECTRPCKPPRPIKHVIGEEHHSMANKCWCASALGPRVRVFFVFFSNSAKTTLAWLDPVTRQQQQQQ